MEYTRGDYAVLPSGNDNLETSYSAQDYIDVATSDDTRVAQSATNEYTIHQFKEYAGAANNCTVRWEGQTDLIPSTSTVYLQVYNIDTSTWETIAQMPETFGSSVITFADSGHFGTEDAGEDFILQTYITDLTDYKDGNTVVTFRVYQLDV